MPENVQRREFVKGALAVAGVSATGLAARPEAFGQNVRTLRLEQLDLGKVQTEPGSALTTEKLRTDRGVRLPPGSSLWVDLKGGAESFSVTVEPEQGSGSTRVKFRASTGAEFRDVVFRPPDLKPQTLTLPLAGRQTLIVEAEAVESRGAFNVLLSDAVIGYTGPRPEAFAAEPFTWETPQWRLKMDGKSGAVVHLSNPRDPHAMNWIRPTGRWGNGLVRLNGSADAWLRPAGLRRTGERSSEVTYDTPSFAVKVLRWIDGRGLLRESYTFTNTTRGPLKIEEGALGILVPLNDRYPGADVCLTQCCNAHVWPGGHAAYVNAVRMGGAAPRLGLVVTEGAVNDYSIDHRAQTSDDRGWFVLHPAPMTLAPSESRTVSWVLFWHEGWDDFFRQAATAAPGFVRLAADEYALLPGHPLRVSVSSATPLRGARLYANGRQLAARRERDGLRAEFTPTAQGEQLVELERGGKRTLLRAFVAAPPKDLIRRRVEFIVGRQQRRAPGDPLDGAYLIYDNETNEQFYDKRNDHNAGRERVGMGVLGALYLPHVADEKFRAELTASLERYEAFVARELQGEDGTVYNDVRRQPSHRLYNYPWVAHLHLALYRATKGRERLQRFVRTLRALYQKGGERFYTIGLRIIDGLKALEEEGMKSEREELLSFFRRHADQLLKTGTNYPKHEVNYEQSIVAPATQILLEVYLATREPAYLEGARRQMVCLEAFNGRQPDYHLNDIAVRHWDGYWFGKRRLYGDTQPHYWSTLTAVAFQRYAEATGDQSYARRAQGILRSNLCYFSADGRASCAYVNPLTVNGRPGRFYDPWANDQDWTLVNWLSLRPDEAL